MINYPSTTIPPEKTGNLRQFEKGPIVALKEIFLSFSDIGEILSPPKSTVLSFYNRCLKRSDVKNLPMAERQRIRDTRIPRRLVRESKKACPSAKTYLASGTPLLRQDTRYSNFAPLTLGAPRAGLLPSLAPGESGGILAIQCYPGRYWLHNLTPHAS